MVCNQIYLYICKLLKVNNKRLKKLNKMGSFINKNNQTTSKRDRSTVNRIVHKAKILTAQDVEDNRSMAYTYLNL